MGLARDSGVENDEMPVKPRGDGGFMPLLIASFNRPVLALQSRLLPMAFHMRSNLPAHRRKFV